MNIDYPSFPNLMNTGWSCPKCGRVWSPTYPGPCTCIANPPTIIKTTTSIPVTPQEISKDTMDF